VRVRVTGGPWPERIGATGRIVTDECDPKIYPRAGLGRFETIVLLDDDPLSASDPTPRIGNRARWTMVIDFRDLTTL
jgi:hypothetical protein